MKVIFSQRFLAKLSQIGDEWRPKVSNLQKKLEAMDPSEVIALSNIRKVPEVQDNMYVLRMENLRLFMLIEYGEGIAEEIIGFLDIQKK